MSSIKITCPVCGAGPAARKKQSLDCPACGTKNAFAEYFASQEVYEAWNETIRQSWNAYRDRQVRRLRSRTSLIVGPESLAFHDADAARLTVFDRFGKTTSETNVQQYSVSNLHQVTLKTGGEVVAKGNNDANQCYVNGVQKAACVQAAPRCTYVADTEGKISAFGACPIREQIAQWTGIKALASGTGHLVGLTKNGTVVQADSSAVGRSTRETASWQNITAIAAASNYTLGLHADGTVSYAGPKADIRQEVAGWRDIAAIAADSQYAIGLTKSGRVLLAGQCTPFLDGGRSSARSWENIICVGAGHGVIAAVTRDGALLLAGSFLYSEEVSAAFKRSNPTKL